MLLKRVRDGNAPRPASGSLLGVLSGNGDLLVFPIYRLVPYAKLLLRADSLKPPTQQPCPDEGRKVLLEEYAHLVGRHNGNAVSFVLFLGGIYEGSLGATFCHPAPVKECSAFSKEVELCAGFPVKCRHPCVNHVCRELIRGQFPKAFHKGVDAPSGSLETGLTQFPLFLCKVDCRQFCEIGKPSRPCRRLSHLQFKGYLGASPNGIHLC